jgi:endonuclease/exonuclease/phosphatase (EEP) superfamily protein YafD
VLQRLVHRGQTWAMPLSLGRVAALPILTLAVASLLILELPLQTLQVEVAQCIRAEAAGLEVLVRSDVGVFLQQVGYAAEDRGRDAIGMEALEQQQRLEVGVGGHASIHPPGVCSARAMDGRWKGSHGGEGARERGRAARTAGLQRQADGHRMRLE